MFQAAQQPVNVWEALRQAILLWVNALRHVWLEAIGFALLSAVPIYVRDHFHLSRISSVLIFAACMLAALIFSNAIYAKMNGVMQGPLLTRSQALAVGMLKWPSSVGAALIMAAGVATVFLLLSPIGAFVSPAIFILLVLLVLLILGSYVSCVFPLIIVENKTAIGAIRESFHLVHKHWWYAASLWIFAMVFSESLNSIAYQGVGIWGTIIGGMLTMPLQIGMLLTIYHQLKLRVTVAK